MDVAASIDRVEELFLSGEPRDALVALSQLVGELTEVSPEAREEALRVIVTRIDHEEPQLGAHLALAAGALVEGGLDARPLARAVVAPLARVLAASKRFVEHAESMPHAGDDLDGLPVGDKILANESVDAIAEEDHESVAAFFSLDTWYRPAVAALTRDVPTLREAQRDGVFDASLGALQGKSPAAHWLGILRKVLFDGAFVVLFPEIDEGYAFSSWGVADMGQMFVLFADALHEPLSRIGVTQRPAPNVVASMRGEAFEGERGTFEAAFHLYAWQAFEPRTGLPRDGRFSWSAPGGTGNHSLPADFLPADIVPLTSGGQSARVLLCVGPDAEGGVRFSRSFDAVRTFSALPARVEAVRKLDAKEVAGWKSAMTAKLAS